MKAENKNTLEDLIEDIDDSDLLLLDESEEETSELIEGKKMKTEGDCEDDEYEMSDDDMSDEEDEDELEEAEVSSDEEFMEYAMTVLKKAHGDDFDEEIATKTAEGILKKADGDYGAAIGMLTSSLGESVLNEAVKCPWKFRLWVDGGGGIEKYVPGRGYDTAKGTFNDENWEDSLDEFRNED